MNRGVLFLTVIIIAICSSCKSNWSGCGRDYYEHKFGAYINGQEYHELERAFSFNDQIYGGFSACSFYNSTGIYIKGEKARGIVSRKGDTSYGFEVGMYIDSTQYDSSTRYFFSDTTLSLSDLFRRKEMVLAPILIGSLKRQNPGDSYNPTVYTIKEGWLLLGDNECIYTTAPDFGSTHYDFVYSYSCARFEFVAKSDSGEVLNVTDGYCKYDFF